MFEKKYRRSASVPRFRRPSYPHRPHHLTEMNPWSEDIVLPPPSSEPQSQQQNIPIDYIRHKLLEVSKLKPQPPPPTYPLWMPTHYLMRKPPPTYEQWNVHKRNGQILPISCDSTCNVCNRRHDDMCSQNGVVFEATAVPFSQLPLFTPPRYSKSCNSYFLNRKTLCLQNNDER